jgi:DNA-binding HxlR family transcriptional regulator
MCVDAVGARVSPERIPARRHPVHIVNLFPSRERITLLRMRPGFGQFCPVAVACEVFAERWTPMILRELLAGSAHFNEIHRGVPLMSRALLSRRLRELENAGVITVAPVAGRPGHRYELTRAGREFGPVLGALGHWGQRWAVRVERRNLDAGFLMWNMRRRIARDRLPDRRVVARFGFTGVPRSYRGPRTVWLLLERTEVDVCVHDPGLDVDIDVEADLATMAGVWLGDVGFDAALRSGRVRLQGPSRLTAAFPAWLLLSHYAGVERPMLGGRRAVATTPRPHPIAISIPPPTGATP